MASYHAVANKLLVEWLPRESWQSWKNWMKLIRDSFLARGILIIEIYSADTQPKAAF